MASVKVFLVLSALVLAICFIEMSSSSPFASPSIDLFGGYDILGVCLRNCAQCKKMFGNFFEGQLCADSCVKFKGKVIPDCEDLASIAPFLSTKVE